MNLEFNPEMLILARESRGLNQSELARALMISQSTVSKTENGMLVPPAEQIVRFAKYLKYSEEFFYLREPIRSFGSNCVYHRKRKTTSDRVLRRLLAMVNVRRIQIRRLLLSVEIDVENRFERFDIDDYDGNAEQIAQTVRSIWKVPPGPVQNLIREIEDAGGIVVRCDFDTVKVDALSQWLPEIPPLFFVNMAIPADRLRFTLAHEIGHIIMHQTPTRDMEREADRFAAEFLMAKAYIKPHLYDLSLPKLATLKPYWKVSMSALLRRASDLGTITPRWRSFLWTQMGKFGYRRVEPVSIPPEKPILLDEIIRSHRKELGYSARDLENLVYSPSESEFRSVFIPHKSGFRVVS